MEDFFNLESLTKEALDWFWDFMPNVLISIVIFFVGKWFARLINKVIRNLFEKKDYDPSLETFLQSLINISTKVIVFVLIITQLGVKSSSLVAMVGAAGLAIGLALQGSLANFAGGVLILLFRPFRVGDYISAQGVQGTVKEITILSTKVNTFGNQLAILPNGQLANNNVINYSVEKTRRDNIKVGIGYSSDIKKAKDILLNICDSHDTILKEPPAEVFVEALGESSVDLTLRFWTNNDDFMPTHFAVLEELKNRFDNKGIEIPFPQRVLHQV